MVLIIPVIFLFILYACLIAFYRNGWRHLPEFFVEKKDGYTAPVAVIIAARNEAKNIAACLHSLLAQTYPAGLSQIRIIDDFSTDDTAAIVQSFAAMHPQIQLVTLQEPSNHQSYKKRAIEAGIAATTAPLIIATDADCTFHPQWIETMIQYQQQTAAQFIAAPVSYITENNTLSVFQTLDFMTLQGITGASVYRRFHTMCNGANLLYTRQAFMDVDGFTGIDHIPTGDDMLLMYKIYRQHPRQVFYLKSKTVIVATAAAHSWRAFLNQRIRWASKAVHYGDKRIFWTLLLVYVFNVYFVVLVIAAFFNLKYLVVLVDLLVAKTLVELWFLYPVAHFFHKKKWLLPFPFLQLLHIPYTIIAGWLGRFGSYQWKGRRIGKSAN